MYKACSMFYMHRKLHVLNMYFLRVSCFLYMYMYTKLDLHVHREPHLLLPSLQYSFPPLSVGLQRLDAVLLLALVLP